MGNLMSPGAATAGPRGPNLVRPSASATVNAEDRRANRTFLSSMVGIIIRDRHGSGGSADARETPGGNQLQLPAPGSWNGSSPSSCPPWSTSSFGPAG